MQLCRKSRLSHAWPPVWLFLAGMYLLANMMSWIIWFGSWLCLNHVICRIVRWCCLQEDEQNLKRHITALEDSIKDMTEDAANSARLYVTDEDIAKLPCTANDTVFAVKAPQGTTLEVPDPDDGLETGQRRYRYAEQHLC
jgi:hypothetical protein